jgi:hypothetical protein
MTNCILNILPFYYFLPFSIINYLLYLHLHWSSIGVDGQQHNGHHRPNVLFLLADDLGFADLDWHDPSLHTPNLRRLAFSAHSVRLSNVYVGPLCTPLVISVHFPFPFTFILICQFILMPQQYSNSHAQWPLSFQASKKGKEIKNGKKILSFLFIFYLFNILRTGTQVGRGSKPSPIHPLHSFTCIGWRFPPFLFGRSVPNCWPTSSPTPPNLGRLSDPFHWQMAPGLLSPTVFANQPWL